MINTTDIERFKAYSVNQNKPIRHSIFSSTEEKTQLINKIGTQITSIIKAGEFNNLTGWKDKTSRYPQKWLVLAMLKSYLCDEINHDALQIVMESCDKYDKGICFRSETGKLVDLALKFKAIEEGNRISPL